MKVLIACECSQTACKEFRKLGHEAYSCDIEQCYGGHPEWHIQGDCIEIIDGGVTFKTEDGISHSVGSGSSLIAFEECGLQYVGYEIDKKYYDMARLRVEEQRGIK